MKLIQAQEDMQVPDDEPVLILRATDPAAPAAMLAYSRAVQDVHDQGTANETAIAVNEHRMAMEQYARENAG